MIPGYWNKLPDGRWRVETLPLPSITEAQYLALPPYLREIPKDEAGFIRWKALNYTELVARVLGGKHADALARRLLQKGVPFADAITAARSAAPASSPAAFPSIVKALQQAGQTAAVAWVQGQATPTAPTAPAAASSELSLETVAIAAALLLLL